MYHHLSHAGLLEALVTLDAESMADVFIPDGILGADAGLKILLHHRSQDVLLVWRQVGCVFFKVLDHSGCVYKGRGPSRQPAVAMNIQTFRSSHPGRAIYRERQGLDLLPPERQVVLVVVLRRLPCEGAAVGELRDDGVQVVGSDADVVTKLAEDQISVLVQADMTAAFLLDINPGVSLVEAQKVPDKADLYLVDFDVHVAGLLLKGV